MPDRVRLAAPAKVNLCLSVGAVRADGYHEVHTVLHALELSDELVITRSDRLTLDCRPSVGVPNERNLAFRAAVAFGESFGVEPNVAIELTKRIPAGSGLGGGSSDAAAVIAALALMHGMERTDPRCLSATATLGADVAFFLHGSAAELRGRGDELVRLLTPLACPIALVHPGTPVPTGAAYAAFDADPQEGVSCQRTADAVESGDVATMAATLANNLEIASATVVPDVAIVLSWLRDQSGVMAGLLAGSGSAAFAIADTPEAAEEICDAARTRGWWATTTALSAAGLDVVDGSSAA